MERRIETFTGCRADYWNAEAVLLGAPFDSTESFRSGARFGPSAIRSWSRGLSSYSPYQDRDLTDYAVFDSGDMELCAGNAVLTLTDVESRVDEVLRDGKLPLLVGGEHLVTLGAVRAAARRYPDLHVLCFDAHADLREDHHGARLSNGSVMRRCWELLGDGRIHQFCVRSGERAEFQFASAHTDLHKFDLDGLSGTVEQLRSRGTPVYLTIDLDCLDPGVFPGTGDPEAGGVGFLELLRTILHCAGLNVVGADAVELAPTLDPGGASTALACKVVRELLLALLSGRKERREREAEEQHLREEAARREAEEQRLREEVARREAEEAAKAAEAKKKPSKKSGTRSKRTKKAETPDENA